MEKNLEYYLGLPYTRELIPEPSGIWFVRIKELPYCMSQGDSPEEAMLNINEAMTGWIEGELEDGETIPEPREEEEYSGKFNLRVPKWLHRRLAEAADLDGMSMNAYISAMLAEAVGRSEANTTRTDQRMPDNFSAEIEGIFQAVGIADEKGKYQKVDSLTQFMNRLEQISMQIQQMQTVSESSVQQSLYLISLLEKMR